MASQASQRLCTGEILSVRSSMALPHQPLKKKKSFLWVVFFFFFEIERKIEANLPPARACTSVFACTRVPLRGGGCLPLAAPIPLWKWLSKALLSPPAQHQRLAGPCFVCNRHRPLPRHDQGAARACVRVCVFVRMRTRMCSRTVVHVYVCFKTLCADVSESHSSINAFTCLLSSIFLSHEDANVLVPVYTGNVIIASL